MCPGVVWGPPTATDGSWVVNPRRRLYGGGLTKPFEPGRRAQGGVFGNLRLTGAAPRVGLGDVAAAITGAQLGAKRVDGSTQTLGPEVFR